MNNGICVAGNMLVDVLYPIQGYPKLGELTSILEGITKSTGGALCNVALDLARLSPALPVTAIGMAGQDADGAFILSELSAFPNINCSRIKREGTTSFTAVMHDVTTNQRSFFHARGGNAKLDEACFDWDTLSCGLLHIGYLLLLDALDAPDDVYGTKMARLLCHAKEYGIKTSVDVVSESGTRYQTIVPPALKYTDYCIINELEAQYTTGVPLREGSLLLEGNIPRALMALREMGVSQWAVIHAPEGAFGMDEAGSIQTIKSPRLPDGFIRGTVGAGDAFCAGVLYAAYREQLLISALELGTAAAVCSLRESGASAGVPEAAEALRLYRSLR